MYLAKFLDISAKSFFPCSTAIGLRNLCKAGFHWRLGSLNYVIIALNRTTVCQLVVETVRRPAKLMLPWHSE